jgi:hypothetical protein
VNLDPVRRCLQEHLGAAVSAAFVYGSVAARRNGPGSDLDCFVLTQRDLDREERQRTRTIWAAVQRDLGFTPDPAYPVELFSTEACHTILASSELDAILRDAAMSGIEPDVAQSDAVEVLRALLDQRLVVLHSACLDVLTDEAWSLVQCQGRHQAALLRALGLNPEAGA